MYYNSLQYSFRVWLTSALAIPHVYLLYYLVTSGSAAYFPISGYLELLAETLLLSIPIGLIFMIVLDMTRNTAWTVKTKKILSLAILEILLLLAFTIIIHGVGDKMISWSSCFDYVVISSFTIAVCIYLYKLKPENKPNNKLSF
jgi:hypothetical protein